MVSQISIPGIAKDEFIELHGEDAFRAVDHQYIISWNHAVYVIDGWAQDSED